MKPIEKSKIDTLPCSLLFAIIHIGTNLYLESHLYFLIASTGRSGPSKKRKVDNVGNTKGLELQWEWEGDGGKWTAYAEDFSSTLTAAYDDGDDHVRHLLLMRSFNPSFVF